MKILITNPDGVSDLMLRQPLFAALLAEGHQLQLVVRSESAALASMLAPAAIVLQCHADPYAPGFPNRIETLDDLVARIRAFQPDLVAVAPFERTPLDEYLVRQFPEVDSVGFNGRLYPGEISLGLDHTSDLEFSRTVTVNKDEPELGKNELLCAAILGRNVHLNAPALHLDSQRLDDARSYLAHVGFEPSRLWVACVGDPDADSARNWGREEWSATLAELTEKYQIQILFVGSPGQAAGIEDMRRRMGGAAANSISARGDSVTPESVAATIALSAGYIGRESGSMHVAAALGKPVIAVMGGGTWPRFTPAAPSGAAITTRVPCSGCDWICHLEESHCVTRIPKAVVLAEFDRVFGGDDKFRKVELDPTPLVAQRMAVEAASRARRIIRSHNATLIALETERQAHKASQTDVDRFKVHSRELTAALADSEQSRVDGDFQLRNERERSAAIDKQRGNIRDLLGSIRTEYEKLSSEFENAKDTIDRLERELEEYRSKMDALESRGEELEREFRQYRLDQAVIRQEYATQSAQLEAIRQSIFTRILSAAGIWRVFREDSKTP